MRGKEILKNMWPWLRDLDYRHYINAVITLVFVAMGIFIFPNAICRLVESFRDFGLSVAYYFCELFLDANPIRATVNDLPSWQLAPSKFQSLALLPFEWDEFKILWDQYWQKFIEKESLEGFAYWLGNGLQNFSRWLLIVLPLFLLGFMSFRRYLTSENNDYDVESKAWKIAKRIADYTYIPIKRWILNYITFLKENSWWYKLWAWMWAFYFNLITIIVEFIAFYLYFITSLDFINIYRQVYKLLLDLSVMIRFIPGIGWAVICVAFLEYAARRRGYDELNHRERRNVGFLAERGVMTIVYGPMGVGKTKTMTDMALSQEVRFRDMAFEIILESDFKFPSFNWSTFEQDLKNAIDAHDVFTVPTVRKWLREKYRIWCKEPAHENIWGYDYERYGLEYDDRLKVQNLWEVLDDYACAYLVYTVQSSLLVSNYSVRVDNLFQDLGNFPQWNTDFFRRDPRLMDSYSRHAHILDFDMLRLGKRILDENPNRFAFGFGVYIISEIDKERKNAPELKDVKSDSKECNQKNDLFNALIKMSRHACVIANKVFVKIFADLQRPESLGADARELGEIVYIEESTDMNPILPFYAPFYLFDALFSLLFGRFVSLYYEYRFQRGDRTLPMQAVKNLTAWLKRYHDRTYNLFGSSCVKLLVESGRMDGERKERKYFLQSKKIYARRYTTDCLSAIFERYATYNAVGIEDLPEYATELGTDEENLMQHSFFQLEVHAYN